MNVKWKDGLDQIQYIPAKMLLFVSISPENFISSFQFGSTTITGPGHYAISYSFDFGPKILAHCESKLCLWGKLLTEKDAALSAPVPQLCMFTLDSIHRTCCAVPYKTETNIINAIEWLIGKPRKEWYDILFQFMIEQERKHREENP